MMSVNNNWYGVGRIAHDLELKQTKEGKYYLQFNLAVSEKKDDKPEFVKCVVWEGRAETIYKYFDKGDQIIISGRLKTSVYENSKRERKYDYAIVVESFAFGQKKIGNLEKKEETRKDEQISFKDFEGDLPWY